MVIATRLIPVNAEFDKLKYNQLYQLLIASPHLMLITKNENSTTEHINENRNFQRIRITTEWS